MKRRAFIKQSGGLAAGLSFLPLVAGAGTQGALPGEQGRGKKGASDVKWPAKFPDSYQQKDGLAARGPIGALPPVSMARPVVEEFLSHQWAGVIRPPNGSVLYPYFVPGSVYKQLWDWDSYFMAMAAPDEYLEVSRGCILNLLTGTLPSGMPPKMALPNGTFFYKAQPLPVHAQFVLMLCKRSSDYKWIEPFWDRLVAIRKWYEAETVVGSYYVWLGFQGNGIDNNPAVYGRPPKTSAGVDLAVWHWRENLCMAHLAKALNKEGAAGYKATADELLGLIRTFYWDPSDEFFYAIDRDVDEKQISQQSITWPTHLKFRNCSSLFPVFMGAASEEQADAVFKRMMDTSEFLSPAGIRSHSAREGLYNNVPMGNPSNWQGPVWALTTCLCSYGLARYGRVEEAKNVAGRLISTYAADLQANKCLHEYYHGDTGQPLSKPEFLSWNLLAARISKDLESGVNPLSIDAV